MKDYGITNIFGDIFEGDTCSWIVLLVGGYFFLTNGCLDNIFGQCDNSIIWIILLLLFLYYYNEKN